MNGEQLTALAGVFEAIPELEFDQTANLAAEAGHDQWTHHAGAAAEPIPELEFDQTFGCKSALRKWHMRRSVGGCGVTGVAGAVRVLWTSSAGV